MLVVFIIKKNNYLLRSGRGNGIEIDDSVWKSIFLATTLRSSGTLWGGSKTPYELSHEDEWAGGGEADLTDDPDANEPLLSWGKAIGTINVGIFFAKNVIETHCLPGDLSGDVWAGGGVVVIGGDGELLGVRDKSLA